MWTTIYRKCLCIYGRDPHFFTFKVLNKCISEGVDVYNANPKRYCSLLITIIIIFQNKKKVPHANTSHIYANEPREAGSQRARVHVSDPYSLNHSLGGNDVFLNKKAAVGFCSTWQRRALSNNAGHRNTGRSGALTLKDPCSGTPLTK